MLERLLKIKSPFKQMVVNLEWKEWIVSNEEDV